MNSLKKLLKTVLDKGHSLWFNKYFISFAIFAVYLCFFDQYNVMAQIKMSSTITSLQEEKVKYQEQLVEAIEQKKMLEKDVERYAREHYFMHKENEDIYIIEEK